MKVHGVYRSFPSPLRYISEGTTSMSDSRPHLTNTDYVLYDCLVHVDRMNVDEGRCVLSICIGARLLTDYVRCVVSESYHFHTGEVSTIS